MFPFQLKQPRLRGLPVILGTSIGFFLLSALIAAQPVSAAETTVFEAIFRLPDSLLNTFRAITYIGTLGLILLQAAAAIYRRDFLRAAIAIPAAALAYALTYLTKEFLLSRARPPEVYGIAPRDDMDVIARDGFPSGHVAMTAAIAVIILFMLPPKWRIWTLIIPAAVGIARIYVGEHLPLDVLGGLWLGVGIGLAAELAMVRSRSRLPSGS